MGEVIFWSPRPFPPKVAGLPSAVSFSPLTFPAGANVSAPPAPDQGVA